MPSNCQCKSDRSAPTKVSYLSLASGILVALIPKCPFCILAYSSAITLCSGSKIYNHTPEWTSYISIGLAVMTLALVLFNFKGLRTILAATLVLSGSLLIVRSEIVTGSLSLYYIGSLLLMVGVWVNANFMYFYRRYFRRWFGFVPEGIRSGF